LDELATAYDEMHDRLGDGEYVVEEQDARPNVVEMLVGARRDRDFGPVVVVGSGGTEAELYRDVRIELAPVDQETARRMIDDLRCRPLLSGWRGRPAVDVGALAAMIVAASELIAASPSISDLEINPVRVAPDGALAVDALVITKENPLV
jgi:acyl-CoA synthetase (NDP forming)